MRQYGLLRHALIRSGRRVPAVAVGAALLAGLLGACGQGQPAANAPAANAPAANAPAANAPAANAPAKPPAASAPASPVTVPVDTRATGTGTVSPNALETLAPFITAAKADDARIRAAAAALNKVATPTTLTFNRTTAATAAAARPNRTEVALPAGMPNALMSASLQVYSDLVSRATPFGFIAMMKDGTVSRTDVSLEQILVGLKKNSTIAARFPADLAALQRVAARTAPVPHYKADSRTAADRFLLITWVWDANHGCASTSGYASGYLPKIVWKQQGQYEGTIGSSGHGDGIAFDVWFQQGTWMGELNAC